MQLPSVSDWLGARSTWGQSDDRADVRTLRRLNKAYDRLAVIGEVAGVLLLVGLCCACAWLLTKTSFEDVVFWDGTDHVCVLDSRSGVIGYVDGR